MKKELLTIVCYLSLTCGLHAQFQEINNGINHGYIMALSVDPETNNLYAGTYGGGVYRSTDNGTNWTAANNGLSGKSLFMSAITVYSNHIFACTESAGIFLSTDNGNSWRCK